MKTSGHSQAFQFVISCALPSRPRGGPAPDFFADGLLLLSLLQDRVTVVELSNVGSEVVFVCCG